jgi:hypothetical protein
MALSYIKRMREQMGSIITYIGFFVSALIVLWAVVTMNRRLYKRRKANVRTMHTWEPLQSTSDDSSEEDSEPQNNTAPRTDSHPRAQQNGHYSQSTKL